MSEPLEKYLACVERYLALVPLTQRREMVSELRGHLDELIAAYIESGATPERAAVLAVRQFGNPARIGQDMARAWAMADEPLDLLKRMAWIWMWSVLFGLSMELCLALACGFFFGYDIMHGASYATSVPATVQLFQRLDSIIAVATFGFTALGSVLGLFGCLPGTKRRIV